MQVLADMQLISKLNNGFRFLLCVIGILKPNKWVDKGNEFYNKTIILVCIQHIMKENLL